MMALLADAEEVQSFSATKLSPAACYTREASAVGPACHSGPYIAQPQSQWAPPSDNGCPVPLGLQRTSLGSSDSHQLTTMGSSCQPGIHRIHRTHGVQSPDRTCHMVARIGDRWDWLRPQARRAMTIASRLPTPCLTLHHRHGITRGRRRVDRTRHRSVRRSGRGGNGTGRADGVGAEASAGGGSAAAGAPLLGRRRLGAPRPAEPTGHGDSVFGRAAPAPASCRYGSPGPRWCSTTCLLCRPPSPASARGGFTVKLRPVARGRGCVIEEPRRVAGNRSLVL